MQKEESKEEGETIMSQQRKGQKQFSVWLPTDTYDFFIQYLETHSLGPNTSERFRQYLYNLQKQTRIPSSLLSPSPNKKFECIRGLKFQHQDKQYFCGRCREHNPSQYRACQEINKEVTQP